MLQHLVLASGSGLSNRLRAIASARRLCERVGAKCSIVWTWGDFHRFFAPLPDATVCHRGAAWIAWWLHRTTDTRERAIDLSRKTVRIHSCQILHGSDEPQQFLNDVVSFVPTLSQRLAARADAFAAERLRGAVGMHIRRTDHNPATNKSPDRLFLDEASRLMNAGKRIFLATDNAETEHLLRRHCGDALIVHPKQAPLVVRWPRIGFDAVALEDDLLDLFLLARSEYVLGSYFSSFSGLAMALNGSPLCRTLSVKSRLPVAA